MHIIHKLVISKPIIFYSNLASLNQYFGESVFNISNISKIGDHNRGQPEGSLFITYYTEV